MIGYFDERKPCPHGHRLARSYHSWIGVVMLALLVPLSLIHALMFINVITTAPLLMPLINFFYWLLAIFFFLFNVFYWGATFRDRLTTSNEARGLADAMTPGREAPDANMVRDRLLRLGNDQWLLTFLIVTEFFFLLFLTIFLWCQGLETWQPLPAGFDETEATNFVLIKGFQLAALAIYAGALIVVLFTGSDFAYRQAMAVNMAYQEAHGQPISISKRNPAGNGLAAMLGRG